MDGKLASALQNLFIIATLLITAAAYVTYNLDMQEYPAYAISYYMSSGVAWTIVTVLIMYLILRSPMYRALTEPGFSGWYYKAAFLALMTGLSVLNGVMGSNDSTLFQSGFVGLMLTGMCSGPLYVAAVTAFTIFVHILVIPDYYDLQWYYLILLLVGGALSALLSTLGKSRFLWYLVPVAVAAVYAVCIPSLLDDAGIAGDPYAHMLYGWSCTAVLLFGCLAVVLYYKYVLLIEAQENAKRTEHDLGLAKDIQQAALPAEFPITRSLNIYGMMEPAAEVAGDFYDCFSIGRNLTAFVTADVSDKGLPASLMMMGVMGSIRAASMLHNDPGRILSAVNREVCARNAAEQFVTVWMGVYDSDTGTLQYANAGHPPPYVRHSDGKFGKLPVKKGLMIGVNEAVRYKTDTVSVSDTDTFFCYTDGVNEAFNAGGEQFGRERFEKTLDASAGEDAEGIVKNVRSAVREFAGKQPQSDDITMLCFIVRRPDYRSLTVPGKAEELGKVNAFIEEVLTGHGFSEKEILKMEIVAEEIFVNICDHAYEDSDGEVTVYCSARRNEMKLTFADSADAFNPISRDEIEIDEDVGNWPIGGFGIHMIKNLVTYMDYKYFAGRNIFTVWKVLGGPESE